MGIPYISGLANLMVFESQRLGTIWASEGEYDQVFGGTKTSVPGYANRSTLSTIPHRTLYVKDPYIY